MDKLLMWENSVDYMIRRCKEEVVRSINDEIIKKIWGTIQMPIEDKIVDLLNEALSLDPEGVQELYQFATKTNKKIEEHPTIVVRDGPRLTLLGLLNGLCDGDKRVAAMLDDKDGHLVGFKTIRKDEVSDR